MAGTTPTIDVLLPVFNAVETVEESLDSILSQSFKDFRVFAVNDGSTDSSLALLNRVAASDQRIVVLDQPNGGIVDALNFGLSHCSAEFIARHDADDLSYSGRFQAQLDYLRANANCVAVGPQARHIDLSGRWLGTLTEFPDPAKADKNWYPSREPYLIHPFLMARKSAFDAVQGYRYVYHAEDTDLYWRMQELGELHVIDDVLGDYRYSPESITSRSSLNGRLVAIYSQLAAISARRRQSGTPDLSFSKSRMADLTRASLASAMFDLTKQDLERPEADYLEGAFAAKLLELTSYRPYELSLDDCRFVSQAVEHVEKDMSPANRAELQARRAKAAARLLRTGKLKEFRALFSRSIAVQAGVYLAINIAARLLPMKIRRSIRTMRQRIQIRRKALGS